MSNLESAAGGGNPDDVGFYIANTPWPRVEAELIQLRQQLFSRKATHRERCRTILNAVMPVLDDANPSLLPYYLMYRLAAAWIEPDGAQIFPQVLERARQRLPVSFAAKIHEEWGHWCLEREFAPAAHIHFYEAQHAFREADQDAEADALWVKRARALLRTDDAVEAVRWIEDWLPNVESDQTRAGLLLEMAQSQARHDDLLGAERNWRAAARQLRPRQGATRDLEKARVYRAQWLWRAGDYRGAGAQLRRAIRWFRAQGLITEARVAQANLAAVAIAATTITPNAQLARDNNLVRAARLLRRLRRWFAPRDPVVRWQVAMNLAVVQEKLGRHELAARLYEELERLPGVRAWEQRLAALNRAHLRLRSPDERVREDLAALAADPVVQGDGFLSFLAGENLGDWHRRNGRHRDAAAWYERALAAVGRSREELPWEFLRRRLQQARLRAFNRLQEVLLEDHDRLEDAWRAADRARAQSLSDFLDGGFPHLDATGARAFRRLRRSLARAYRLHWLQGQAQQDPAHAMEFERLDRIDLEEAAARGGQGTVLRTEIACRIDQRERRLDRVLGLAKREYSTAASAVNQHEVLERQRPGVVLIQYVEGEWGLGAYVIRDGAVKSFHPLPLHESAAAAESRVRHWWSGWSKYHDKASDWLPEERWRSETAYWHRACVAPLAGELEGAEQVLVAPHGRFCLLPWAGLWDEQKQAYWADQFPGGIAVLPNARAGFRTPPAAQENGVVLIVSPDSDLAFTGLATAWLQERLGERSRVLQGRDATPASLRRMLPACRWLHFTGHGAFDRMRPMASHLDLGHGRRWTAWDMLLAPLPGTTVVLSACEVGSADAEAAGEWLGLLRGFLLAGARSVAAALWQVDELAMLAHLQAFYDASASAGGDQARALRSAQVRARNVGAWARRARDAHARQKAPKNWAPALQPGCGLWPEDGPAARDGLAILAAAVPLWLTKRGILRLASPARIWQEVGDLIGRLALLEHPRHWAALQLYGTP